MDDLIRRKATIDAINTWDKFGVDKRCRIVKWREGLELYVRLRDVLTAIVNQPSAQSEIIRCKYCRHRIVNDHYVERGYLKIKAYCELDTGDPFELSRNAENDEWFCADAERRTE